MFHSTGCRRYGTTSDGSGTTYKINKTCCCRSTATSVNVRNKIDLAGNRKNSSSSLFSRCCCCRYYLAMKQMIRKQRICSLSRIIAQRCRCSRLRGPSVKPFYKLTRTFTTFAHLFVPQQIPFRQLWTIHFLGEVILHIKIAWLNWTKHEEFLVIRICSLGPSKICLIAAHDHG